MAGIDSLRRVAGAGPKGIYKRSQLRAESLGAPAGDDKLDLLLLRGCYDFCTAGAPRDANDLKGGKMLASGGGLLQRQCRRAFNDESVEVLGKQIGNRLRHAAHNALVEATDLIEQR